MADLVFVSNAKDASISAFGSFKGNLKKLTTHHFDHLYGPLTYNPVHRQLYAGGSEPNEITILKIDTTTGALSHIASTPIIGKSAYLAISYSSNRKLLASASYHDGTLQLFRLDFRGYPTGIGEVKYFANLHSVTFSPDGLNCYAVSLHDDLLAQYRIDANGLVPLGQPTVSAPPGSGPRHLLFDNTGSQLYVTCEFSGQVLRYERNTTSGELKLAQEFLAIPDLGLQHSSFGADPKAEGLIWTSDLHFDPTQSVLYVAERNCSTISTISVKEDGSLSELIGYDTVVNQPRGFAVLPDCSMVVASETDQIIGHYQPRAGKLELLGEYQVGKGANWIAVVH